MKHLAILYTNNNIDPRVFSLVLSCFAKTLNHPSLIFDTLGVIVSRHPVALAGCQVKNIVAPAQITNKGHVSIIDKICLALALFPSDFVSLHEHDALYPEEYLVTIQDILEEVSAGYDYLAYNNLLGVNKTGYQQRTVLDYPFSTLTFPSAVLKDLLDHKRQEYAANGNWCYLEPGYGGSYGTHFRRLAVGNGYAAPVVHINMNQTSRNHHFTNHYLTYEPVSQIGFSAWPGNLAFLFG